MNTFIEELRAVQKRQEHSDLVDATRATLKKVAERDIFVDAATLAVHAGGLSAYFPQSFNERVSVKVRSGDLIITIESADR